MATAAQPAVLAAAPFPLVLAWRATIVWMAVGSNRHFNMLRILQRALIGTERSAKDRRRMHRTAREAAAVGKAKIRQARRDQVG